MTFATAGVSLNGVRLDLLLLLAGSWALAATEARGMFARYQTKTVPIGRLFTNLQQRLETEVGVDYAQGRLVGL